MTHAHTIAAACLLAAAALVQAAPGRAADCGGMVSCKVAHGSYRLELPKGKARGVYVYFHGYSASAESQMKQRQIVDTVLAHHLAFAAPDGIDGSWTIPGAPERLRDDQAFAGAVLDDVQHRLGFTPDNTMVGGFSLGASMAWYVACRQGDRFHHMLTFSGVFWDPLPKPEECTAALPAMIHVHGRADGTFPLAGRAIGDHYHQGDTFKSLEIFRKRAQCAPAAPVKRKIAGLDCEVAPGCTGGTSMLCLHGGGHVVVPAHLDAALDASGFPR